MLMFTLMSVLWLLSLIPLIIFLYFLRIRFRKQPISSNFIWSKLSIETKGHKKLIWTSIFFLILQLLAFIIGVFAGTKPFLERRKEIQHGIVYIIDTSASMRTMSSDLVSCHFLPNQFCCCKNMIRQ